MSKTKVHVIIPYQSESACGIKNPHRNAMYRDMVTCPSCKKTEHYKNLSRVKKVKS